MLHCWAILLFIIVINVKTFVYKNVIIKFSYFMCFVFDILHFIVIYILLSFNLFIINN